eukprot:gb/GECH01000333.1/.p1 GENE.gb/GECH01000333.1/~~gb/GECH01000333.1/.p1  ORF type:complete len:218 (+),score=31.31 gb/GECH01000333.1/:1-654(+)
MSTESHRLWRVRRTVLQMLRDRDYFVSTSDMEMSFPQFTQEYGEKVTGPSDMEGYAANISRERMLIMTRKKDDPSDLLFVFFASEPKIGVKPIRSIHKHLQDNQAMRAILVVQQQMTNYAKEAIRELLTKGFVVESFLESELLVNITQHELVPQHIPLSTEDKDNLLQKYKLKDWQLPRIKITDPVARYYGLRKGQVVKIVRPSETAGRYVTYRLVV